MKEIGEYYALPYSTCINRSSCLPLYMRADQKRITGVNRQCDGLFLPYPTFNVKHFI